jgi:hypothetical protein
MTPHQNRAKLASLQREFALNDIKLSKSLVLIDGMLDALNEAVSVIAKHGHSNDALNRLNQYLEIVINTTNDKLIDP